MCGRYYVDDDMAKEIEKLVKRMDESLRNKTGDIYPSNHAMVLCANQKQKEATGMIWGFPNFAKKGLIINARAESAVEKKIFRNSVLYRRCIVPARSYYEWDKSKNKVSFMNSNHSILYMAGCYNQYDAEDRFVIFTTEANASVINVHLRMPLILDRNEIENWLFDDTCIEFILQKTPSNLTSEINFIQQELKFNEYEK